MAGSKVETISRLAQWKIENLGPCSYKKSEPFKVGIWNWHLSIEKTRYLWMCIRLFPEHSRIPKEQSPIARFILRVSNAGAARKIYTSPVHERLLRTAEDFVWHVDTNILGPFIIDVEFLDLKICPLNDGEASSIWLCEKTLRSLTAQSTLGCLSRMLDEGIHADLTIKTSDCVLKAHKAVLSASSAVFQSMFHHNFKEKESSTIQIEDMSTESCMTLLSYLYGTIKQGDFRNHRLALLGAADKYDISGLKDACEESLLEDLNSGNVLERLQAAWKYQLEKLKKGCMTYLFDFGKVYDVREDINNFFGHADRELLLEMFQQVLTGCEPV